MKGSSKTATRIKHDGTGPFDTWTLIDGQYVCNLGGITAKEYYTGTVKQKAIYDILILGEAENLATYYYHSCWILADKKTKQERIKTCVVVLKQNYYHYVDLIQDSSDEDDQLMSYHLIVYAHIQITLPSYRYPYEYRIIGFSQVVYDKICKVSSGVESLIYRIAEYLKLSKIDFFPHDALMDIFPELVNASTQPYILFQISLCLKLGNRYKTIVVKTSKLTYGLEITRKRR